MFNKSPRPTSYYQEWQVDNLFPPNFSGVLEGQDASTFDNAAENRARIGNYVQKFWRKWAVSDIVEAADVAGVSNEVANAKMKKLREIKRDIEAAIGADNEMQGRPCKMLLPQSSDYQLDQSQWTWFSMAALAHCSLRFVNHLIMVL